MEVKITERDVEFEKRLNELREKRKKIKNLALTTVQEMSKLGFTHKDIKYLHNYLDEITENLKIIL